MHKLVVKIDNSKNYQMFLNMLKHIDFVEIEEQEELKENVTDASLKNLFGIWAKRDITIENIREKAWK
jgi:ribosome-interacting GTPase 1